MIHGHDIADALSTVLPAGDNYDPDGQGRATQLPGTMRELVEGRFRQDMPYEGEVGAWRSHLHLMNVDGSERMPAAVVRIKDLPVQAHEHPRRRRFVRPLGPQLVEDFRWAYPLLSAFWAWAKNKRIARQIDVDHPLSVQVEGCCHGWPIWNRFEAELGKRGMSSEDIFPQNNWHYDGELAEYDRAYMPLYFEDSEEADVPLLELLTEIAACVHRRKQKFDRCLPEVAYSIMAEERGESGRCMVDHASAVLGLVLAQKKFTVLPELWAVAIEGLKNYQGNWLTISDWEQALVNIRSKNRRDIDNLFCCCRDVADMRKTVDPLVKSVLEDPPVFWRSFVEKMNVLKTT